MNIYIYICWYGMVWYVMYVCMYVCVWYVMLVCMHACMHACMHGWMDGWMYKDMFRGMGGGRQSADSAHTHTHMKSRHHVGEGLCEVRISRVRSIEPDFERFLFPCLQFRCFREGASAPNRSHHSQSHSNLRLLMHRSRTSSQHQPN